MIRGIQQKRAELKERRSNQDLHKELLDEIKTISSMLSNQHLYDADKASVAALFAAATTKLRKMGTLQPPAAAGDGNGVVTPAPTPTKGPSWASKSCQWNKCFSKPMHQLLQAPAPPGSERCSRFGE
jgi:hypothetical protein